MNLKLALLALPLALSAQTPQPHSSSANFSTAMKGTTQPMIKTGETAGLVVYKVSFSVPSGSRVHILHVYGDFVVWPGGVPLAGKHASGQFSLYTSSPDDPVTSVSPLLTDNCFLSVNQVTTGDAIRAPFDTDVSAGGLLSTDNALFVRIAVAENDTELEIHMEPSFTIVYQVESTP